MRNFFRTVALTTGVILLSTAGVYGESITGTLYGVDTSSAPLNISVPGVLDWAVYGRYAKTANMMKPVLKSDGPQSFTPLTTAATKTDVPTTSGFMNLSYTGGTSSFFVCVRNNSEFTTSPSTLTMSHTLLAASEAIDVYLTSYNTQCILSATLGSTQWSYANGDHIALLSTNGDGSGMGQGWGRLALRVNGTVGQTLNFNITTNVADLTNASLPKGPSWANVGIQAATVSAVPEPSTVAMLASGLIGLLAYAWRKRK